jgi:hypothetical protein
VEALKDRRIYRGYGGGGGGAAVQIFSGLTIGNTLNVTVGGGRAGTQAIILVGLVEHQVLRQALKPLQQYRLLDGLGDQWINSWCLLVVLDLVDF